MISTLRELCAGQDCRKLEHWLFTITAAQYSVIELEEIQAGFPCIDNKLIVYNIGLVLTALSTSGWAGWAELSVTVH